jgi:hypothetical protein
VVTAVALLGIAAGSSAARAEDKEKDAKGEEHPPGYVDGSALGKLPAHGGQVVEVTLKRPMLRVLSKTYAKKSKLMAGFLGRLHSVEAVVAEFDPVTFKLAQAELQKITQRLDAEGWERLARIREDSQEIKVYALTDGDEIDGLVVCIVDGAIGGKVIFTNLAGRIDLSQMPFVYSYLEIPGLEEGVQAIEMERAARDKEAGEEPDSEQQDTEDEGGHNEGAAQEGAK